jgi:N utilization substance protein A
VTVPEKQLSLAIGKDGQNARLAAKLTGWRVDVTKPAEGEIFEESFDDRQEPAIAYTGRRERNERGGDRGDRGSSGRRDRYDRGGDRDRGGPKRTPYQRSSSRHLGHTDDDE